MGRGIGRCRAGGGAGADTCGDPRQALAPSRSVCGSYCHGSALQRGTRRGGDATCGWAVAHTTTSPTSPTSSGSGGGSSAVVAAPRKRRPHTPAAITTE
jgi:hypothetical protein